MNQPHMVAAMALAARKRESRPGAWSWGRKRKRLGERRLMFEQLSAPSLGAEV